MARVDSEHPLPPAAVALVPSSFNEIFSGWKARKVKDWIQDLERRYGSARRDGCFLWKDSQKNNREITERCWNGYEGSWGCGQMAESYSLIARGCAKGRGELRWVREPMEVRGDVSRLVGVSCYWDLFSPGQSHWPRGLHSLISLFCPGF